MLVTLLQDFGAALVFGAAGILLIAVAFKVFDKITPKLDLEDALQQNNTAVAIFLSAVVLGICYLASTTISSVVGGH